MSKVSKNLKKYVNDKLHAGLSEDIIKHNLINAGWDENEVEEALNQGYKHKRNRFLVGTLSITAILIITLGLIATFSFYDNVLEGPENDQDSNEREVSDNTVVSLSSCQDADFENKHACYFEKIQEDFDCTDLDDEVEKNYCYRALEEFYLQ